jgi:hypothetical protein
MAAERWLPTALHGIHFRFQLGSARGSVPGLVDHADDLLYQAGRSADGGFGLHRVGRPVEIDDLRASFGGDDDSRGRVPWLVAQDDAGISLPLG